MSDTMKIAVSAEDCGLFDPEESHVTGTLIFRDSSGPTRTEDGRRVMMVFGVIAVPDEFQPQGEHQYVVVGDKEGKSLTVLKDGAKKIDEKYHRYRPDQLLCSPIWRT